MLSNNEIGNKPEVINYKSNINSYSLKNIIENEISIKTLIRSGFPSDYYSNYFSSGRFHIKIKNNSSIIILIKKTAEGRYPTSRFLEKFIEILTTILNNELSSSKSSKRPFTFTKINYNEFIFGGTRVVVKNYKDSTRVEKIQVNKIKDFLKDLNENNISKFRILNDEYEIDFNAYNSIDDIVKVINQKADCYIQTTSGPIYFSLKGETYRQFGGISVFKTASDKMYETDIQDFIDKLKKYISTNNIKPGENLSCFRQISSKQLINMSVFGRNYGSSYGPNNVNYLLIGNIILNGNILSSSTKAIKNGENINKTFYIISTTDKGRNDGGIKDTRIGIYDYKYKNANIEI